MEAFWGRQSTNTLDRATAMMPRLLYDRLDELGLDYCVIYPTAGLSIPRIADDATRRAVIRGFNIVTFDFFKGLEDRLTPVAVIPVHTPDEAIEELEFVVKQLGAKVCMFGSGVRRVHQQAKGVDPDVARLSRASTSSGSTASTTTIPLWRKCRSSGSRRRSIPAAAATASATARPTSPSTTSATSPPPSTPWRRRCSWAA
jgi:predicted TIM-barrel fold metal-dependent hydrolase